MASAGATAQCLDMLLPVVPGNWVAAPLYSPEGGAPCGGVVWHACQVGPMEADIIKLLHEMEDAGVLLQCGKEPAQVCDRPPVVLQ